MKRLSASLLALLSVSAFVAACGGSNEEATSPQASASASAPPPATATAAANMPPAATATAVAEAPKPPAPEPGADLKIVPMKMTLGTKGGVVELKADGTVWGSKPGAKPEQMGNISKNSFNITSGKPGAISVLKDNSVSITDADKKPSFDDKDAFVLPDGAKMTIDDKGKVELWNADGKKDTKSPAPTFTGFKPEARRTALVLSVLFMLMPGEPTVTVTSKSACDDAKKPAACPGGGAPKCDAGKWSCPPLPHQ